jgi:hypothetical protein
MEPGLTDLTFVDVQEMGSIPPLRVELPQEVAFPDFSPMILGSLPTIPLPILLYIP